MANFTGQLRTNELFAGLYNAIISRQIFADNIRGTFSRLVEMARVDGSKYGDQKLYFGADIARSVDWIQDSEEAINVLKVDRPVPPKTQAIVLNIFRQVSLTVDEYMSARAWKNEGTFAEFNSVILAQIRDTKRIYDSTLYNAFIGTDVSAIGKQAHTVKLPAKSETDESANRLRAEKLAEDLANLFIDMEKPSRDYNDWKFLRSYDLGEVKVIWNSKYVNEIRKVDLPTIFHKDGLVDKFEQYVLPDIYFGKVGDSRIEAASNDGTKRSMIEKDYNVKGGKLLKMSDSSYKPEFHVFPGDLIPSKTALQQAGMDQPNLEAKTYYTVEPKAICKIYTRLPDYMSAFEVGTSFFNPKNLSTNHYLTFAHNTLEHFSNYPCITVKEQ